MLQFVMVVRVDGSEGPSACDAAVVKVVNNVPLRSMPDNGDKSFLVEVVSIPPEEQRVWNKVGDVGGGMLAAGYFLRCRGAAWRALCMWL